MTPEISQVREQGGIDAVGEVGQDALGAHAHLVFVTKYRRGAFTDPMLTRCGQIMTEVCDKFGATLTEFTGETDHVHLLIHYPPTVQLSTLVNSLKGVSARYLRQEFPDHIQKYLWGNHFWSPSYFAASAGGAPLAIVAEYITNQNDPNPHKKATPLRAIAQYKISFLPAPQGPGFL